jgi:hypothetical protein
MGEMKDIRVVSSSRNIWTEEKASKTQAYMAGIYCHDLGGCVTYKTGFGLVIGFIDHLRVVSKNNYNTIVDLHATNDFTLSLFPLVITW